MRKIAAACTILLFAFGVAMAEEFRASITKIDGNKITVSKTKFNKDTKKLEKGEEMTLTLVDSVKVAKGKFNKDAKKLEAGDALEGGLKNEAFSKLPVSATIVTNNDGKVTEIITGGFGGGGIKKKKKVN
jgi:hypothetical protein